MIDVMQAVRLIGGRYHLLNKLGEGAMGIVWEAENVLTRRRVALKLVLHSNEHHRRRLLKEAGACGRLRHHNIIEVLDVGETESGEPFLVMPLLTGETVAEFLARKRRLAPWRASQIGRDIARALTVAHAAGIIHRDLKPANTFLHREPGAERVVVKVLDFGVCKEIDPKVTVLTVDGRPIGTPAYMSPEQFNPRVSLDHRTDIWSLGVVLFEMLAGVRPFRGDRLEEVIAKIIAGPIPTVAQLVRSVPPGLVSIVSRCLTRDREERIGSAEELAALLEVYACVDAEHTLGDAHGRISSERGADATSATMTSVATQSAGSTDFAASTSAVIGASVVDEWAVTRPLRRFLLSDAIQQGEEPESDQGTHEPDSPATAGITPRVPLAPGPSAGTTVRPRGKLFLVSAVTAVLTFLLLTFALRVALSSQRQREPRAATALLDGFALRRVPSFPETPSVKTPKLPMQDEPVVIEESSELTKGGSRRSGLSESKPGAKGHPISSSKSGVKASTALVDPTKAGRGQDRCGGRLIKRCPPF